MLGFIKAIFTIIKCWLNGVKYAKGSTIAFNVKVVGGGKTLKLKPLSHVSRNVLLVLSPKSEVVLETDCRLHPFSKIETNHGSSVLIGKGAYLSPYSLVFAHGGSEIVVGNGSMLSNYTTVTSINKVIIGDDVLMGPNVFIADYNHDYRDITKAVVRQGNISTASDGTPNEVHIGNGTWIGKNAVIVGNVTIGEHCVIGANSTVTKDIPSFSVAAGNPAKVIKRYDFDTQKWIRV